MRYWSGPSEIDGQPIQLIITAGSKNSKTGPMLQTWILRADIDPVAASRVGADSSVCGDCPERHYLGGRCYVTLFQAPLSTWRAHDRDPDTGLADVATAIRRRTPLRIGAYGDPAAVPAAVWRALMTLWSDRGDWRDCPHTGYTHQWRSPRVDEYRDFLMASCDGPDEVREANRLGWRAFYMLTSTGEVAHRSDLECLSESRGKACADCRLCDGARSATVMVSRPVNIRILPHGARA